MTLLDIMRASPVIPVIAIDDINHAVPLARALVAGGIRVLEVTLRTAHGLPAIRAMAEQVPDAIRSDGRTRGRLSPAETVPCDAGGRRRHAQCTRRAAGRRDVLPHRRRVA